MECTRFVQQYCITSKLVYWLSRRMSKSMAPIFDFGRPDGYNLTSSGNAKRNLCHFRSHVAVPLLLAAARRLKSLSALFIEPDAVWGSVGKCTAIKTSEITTNGVKVCFIQPLPHFAPASPSFCSLLSLYILWQHFSNSVWLIFKIRNTTKDRS